MSGQKRRKVQQTFEIERLGAKGDGIGHVDGAPVYVPYTLPGEVVGVELGQKRGEGVAASLTAIKRPSPQRVAPPCKHFGICGNCVAQHMDDDLYRSWKLRSIEEALQRRGLVGYELRPMAVTPPQARRRATITAQKARGETILGFHMRASHVVFDLQECWVVLPAIAGLVAPLRELLNKVLNSNATITINSADNGLDVAVAAKQSLDITARQTLAAFAAAQDLARLSWDGEPVATRRNPMLQLGALSVELPIGGFLQASVEGEMAMRQAIAEWTPRARSLADLYGGVGTLSLSLAPDKRVHLVEGDEAAAAAAAKAAKQPAARSRLSVERRDLARQPLSPDELDKFDAVMFDPPRAGAAEQSALLARSAVPTVIAVSCDPGTFARDARMLVDGGYRLAAILPIDQFLWSSHVELVAQFVKKRI